jgi:glycosyltransferase involved in cell wall biosynthesis
MRILLSTYSFAPAVGGLETVARLLAREWVALGHEVRVVTRSPGPADPATERVAPVIRRPGLPALAGHLAWCDVFFQNNLSLRLAAAWPLCPRPWVTAHQAWLIHPGTRAAWHHPFKTAALRLGRSVAISRAVAAALPVPASIIPNPYDASVFTAATDGPAPARDLVFVGRLVSDKGAGLLVEALSILHRAGDPRTATIVGAGPEEPRLRAAVLAAGLAAHVDFTGILPPGEVTAALRRHRLLVVPSLWPEPFGIVALEGLAAGCRVVVSDGGGLPEAVGGLGRVFHRADGATGLAAAIRASLAAPPPEAGALARHLAGFHPATIARRYLELFEGLLT